MIRGLINALSNLFGGVAGSAAQRAAASVPEIDEIRAFADNLRLPHLELIVGDAPPDDPVASRLGGPAWVPDGHAAPSDRHGQMLFLAQINFAEAPTLEDFPEAGLMQVFISNDEDVYGCEFPSRNGEGFQILFWPEPGAGSTVPQVETGYGPFQLQGTQIDGRALTFATGTMRPAGADWRLEEMWMAAPKGGAADLAMDKLFDDLTMDHPPHHVGGHPNYTQADIRQDEQFAHFDRVLLQLGCDDHIMWGDCGEAAFMIRAEDLRQRNFAAAIYTWDCC